MVSRSNWERKIQPMYQFCSVKCLTYLLRHPSSLWLIVRLVPVDIPHSTKIIQAHPEMELYVGLDVDLVAHEIAQAQINMVSHNGSCDSVSSLQVHTFLKNFKNTKAVLQEVGGKHSDSGIQGVLMDLGMSSMQVKNAEKGFSVLSDGPLDMRMNPQGNDRQA